MNLELMSAGTRSQATYAPNVDDVPVTSDPGSALLALMLKSRGTESDAARSDVNHAFQALEEARRQMREALEQAQKAQEHSGFFGALGHLFSGDIAAIGEAVASAAAIVATGGVGAAGVLALVAAGMSIGADVGEKAGLDSKFCLALAVGGAVTGIAAGQLDAPAGLWDNVAKGGHITSAAASTAGSAAEVASDRYRADAMDAQADAESARGAQDDAMFRFNAALEVLQKCARDVQRATSTVADMTKQTSDGKSALIARMRAA